MAKITPQTYRTLSLEINGDAKNLHAGDEVVINSTTFPVVRRLHNPVTGEITVVVAKTAVRVAVQKASPEIQGQIVALTAKSEEIVKNAQQSGDINDVELMFHNDEAAKLQGEIDAEVRNTLIGVYGFSDTEA